MTVGVMVTVKWLGGELGVVVGVELEEAQVQAELDEGAKVECPF